MTSAVHVIEPDVDDGPELVATFEFRGKRFPVREQGVSLLALMKFATIAKRGRTSDDMEGLAALYALLQSCVAPSAWDEFEEHANETGADGEALMLVVRDAIAAASPARPTLPPSGSPDGRSTTAPSSAGASSSPASSYRQGDRRVQRDLEQRGRPDLALVVKRAREASTSASTR
jgi:hypothetical protein